MWPQMALNIKHSKMLKFKFLVYYTLCTYVVNMKGNEVKNTLSKWVFIQMIKLYVAVLVQGQQIEQVCLLNESPLCAEFPHQRQCFWRRDLTSLGTRHFMNGFLNLTFFKFSNMITHNILILELN